MTKKICISGYYGFDNFGDETILKVLINNLKNYSCNPEITVFSSNPDKTKELYQVNAVKSFNIKQVIKELLKCDCLISGGGSLLQDVTSKKSLIYYLAIISIATFFRKKVIIFAQGIGPINDKFLSKLTAFILKKASYITVRDERSLNLLKSWNINANLCSDPVWNIQIPLKEKSNKIGIQLRDFYSLNDDFIKEFAKSINKYYSNKEICILSLQNKLDEKVCNQLKEELLNKNNELNVKVIENNSNDEVIENIASLDELIAMRYHACLIGLLSGIKVLPINYDIKVDELAKEFELNCLNLDKISEINDSLEQFVSANKSCNKEKLTSLLFDFKTLEERL